MQIKLSEIVNSTEQLKNLLEVKLPVKISYRINRLVNKLNPILQTYNEKRNDLIKEFGEEQEDKSISVKDPEKLKLFAEKLQELLQVEEKLDFDKINIEDLGEVVIAPKDIPEFIFA